MWLQPLARHEACGLLLLLATILILLPRAGAAAIGDDRRLGDLGRRAGFLRLHVLFFLL